MSNIESLFRKERKLDKVSTKTMSVAVMLVFLFGEDRLHCRLKNLLYCLMRQKKSMLNLEVYPII